MGIDAGDIERIKNTTIKRLGGDAVPLGWLWAERPAVITWLRHYG